jgi:hypothetical protein
MCRIRQSCMSIALTTCVLGAIGTGSAPVRADDSSAESEWAFAAGAKLWENTWESWIVVPTPFNRGSREVTETINSNTKVAVIPQLSIRYGDWLGTVSALTPTNYTLTPSWGTPLAASRYEIDGNLGYYMLPGLALTAGYKQVEQKFGGTFKWHGPTVGASGTAGLGKGFSLYGTVGVGYMKAELPFADGADQTSLNANYVLGEAGVAYSFGALGRLTRSLNVTLGYRSQTLTTRGYGLADTSTTPPTVSRQDVRDTTQGPTLSVVAVF